MSYWQDAVGKKLSLYYTEVVRATSQTSTLPDCRGVLTQVTPQGNYEYTLRLEDSGGAYILDTAGEDLVRGVSWFRTYVLDEDA